MKIPPRSIFVLAALCVLANGVPSLPADSLGAISETLAHLPSADREAIAEDGEISRFHSGGDDFILVPDIEILAQVRSALAGIRANVGVEVLFSEPIEGDFGNALELMNLLLSVSTMKGIEYYSESRARMRVLFAESHMVDGPKQMNRVPDPVVETLDDRVETFAVQNDTTFGKSLIHMTFQGTEQYVWLEAENITPYRYMMIPMIRSERMRLWVFVYVGDGFVLFYGAFGARAGSLSLFEDRIQKSFYNRLVALHGWFMARLAESRGW